MVTDQARKLGMALVNAKILTPGQLSQAMEWAEQERSPSLIIALLELNLLTFRVFEKFLASSVGVKSAIIGDRNVDVALLSQVGLQVIADRMVFPINLDHLEDGPNLILGMVDPLDKDTAQDIQTRTGYRITTVLISLPDFKEALVRISPDAGEGVVDARMTGSHRQQDYNKELEYPSSKAITADAEKFSAPQPTQSNPDVIFSIPGMPPAMPTQAVPAAPNVPPNMPPPPPGMAGIPKPRPIQDNMPSYSTRTVQPKPGWDRAPQGTQSVAISNTPPEAPSNFLGSTRRKFREEIILKLEIPPAEIQHLNLESYSKEDLYDAIRNLSNITLEKIYYQMQPEPKAEALSNVMIQQGLASKEQILVWTAVGFVFHEESK